MSDVMDQLMLGNFSKFIFEKDGCRIECSAENIKLEMRNEILRHYDIYSGIRRETDSVIVDSYIDVSFRIHRDSGHVEFFTNDSTDPETEKEVTQFLVRSMRV